MPTLIADSAGPDLAVGQVFIVVGRHPECDVPLDSHQVSRWHCIVAKDGGVVFVRDLGSRNCTVVEAERRGGAADPVRLRQPDGQRPERSRNPRAHLPPRPPRLKRQRQLRPPGLRGLLYRGRDCADQHDRRRQLGRR
jgi:hypothetical protein